MSNVIDLYPDSSQWQQLQQCEERQYLEIEEAKGKLQSMIQAAIEDGARHFEDLQQSELKRMTAQAIRARAADPKQAWFFIGLAPGSESYPGLVADALDREFGGNLGLERTGNRLLKAVLDGAVQYGRHIIEDVFDRELERRRTRQ